MVTDKKMDKNAKTIGRERFFDCAGFTVSKTGALKGFVYPRHRFLVQYCDTFCRDVTGSVVLTPLIAAKAGTGVMAGAVGLAIDAVATKFKVGTAFSYLYAGQFLEKAAATALTFTAGHVVSANKYGIILVQMTSAGTVSTKVPSATQAYNSAAEALAAKPAPDASNFEIGYIAIANNAGDWTANTDDLTNGSGVTTATFNSAASIGRNPLAAAITFADNTITDEALNATPANRIGSATDALYLTYTTDGTGAVAGGDAFVRFGFRIYGVNGEA